MVISRKCRFCSEPFDTTKRGQVFCSNFCKLQFIEKQNEKKKKEGRKK